ncbi:zinc finger protein 574 [Pararge aegeria]|uniref:zinc finger protein 574 n=1 Tax=Pararge aegeria TaxID=116150 RepID=UPI0019D2B4DF|nr:zinc finger protein 574 [Pararge aegeria]
MCTRLLSRRGLRRGARSRSFAPRDLLAAAPAENVSSAADRRERRGGDWRLTGAACAQVYADVDAAGRLRARGGVARAVRAARLADAAPHADALLCAERAPAEPRLRLRLAADAPPLAELRLWFDERTLALLDMPFLTLRNITAFSPAGRHAYVCHECGATFEQPNPLKTHLFLACAPFAPAAFWARCAARLGAPGSAPAPSAPPAPPPAPDPARLEALAAAWGRARGGHVCVFCGKLYSRRYGLKIHIRTHTGYKPLRCRHCLRAFGDPSNLNKHVRLHAAPPAAPAAAPHACPLCRKPLARRRDLLRHLRAQHAGAPAT